MTKETLFKHIESPTIDIYYNDEFVATANEIEFRTLLVEIAKNKATGYSIDDDGEMKTINEKGKVIGKFPKRFSFSYELAFKLLDY